MYRLLKRLQWLLIIISISLETQPALGRKIAQPPPSFPRTVIINLPRSTKRRARMTQELARHNIPFHWLDAVDGREDPAARSNALTTPLGRWFMTPGMIGCFLSHRKCWQLCVETGKPLLVFEDDVVLQNDFCNIVSNAMKTLLEVEDNEDGDDNYTANSSATRDKNKDNGCRWDVLLLGALGCVHPQKIKFGFNWIPSLVGGKWRKTRRVASLSSTKAMKTKKHAGKFQKDSLQSKNGESPFLHTPMCPYGMHAYVIHPRGAQKLLEKFPRACYHVDVVAWGFKELQILALHPLIAWQTNQDTTIGGLVHLWKGIKILPTWIADQYTGFEVGWALSAPLLRVGGPLWGGSLLLTNGNALLFLALASCVAIHSKSYLILGLTLAYVTTVTLMIRFLSSPWNS